jgi:hypothetical protein
LFLLAAASSLRLEIIAIDSQLSVKVGDTAVGRPKCSARRHVVSQRPSGRRSLRRWVLLQLPLQGSAVHPEAARGLGNVAATVGEDTVDVLPLGTGQ